MEQNDNSYETNIRKSSLFRFPDLWSVSMF